MEISDILAAALAVLVCGGCVPCLHFVCVMVWVWTSRVYRTISRGADCARGRAGESVRQYSFVYRLLYRYCGQRVCGRVARCVSCVCGVCSELCRCPQLASPSGLPTRNSVCPSRKG